MVWSAAASTALHAAPTLAFPRWSLLKRAYRSTVPYVKQVRADKNRDAPSPPSCPPHTYSLSSPAQSFNWDCGMACAEMVLRALGVPPAQCGLGRLQSLLPAECTSVWTVDLAYALHHFGVRFQFLTTTCGVDPAYEAEPFYKATLDAVLQPMGSLTLAA